MVAADDRGILAGDVEIAIRTEENREWMEQPSVRGVVRGEDAREVVLAVVAGRALESENLAGILKPVGQIEIAIGAKGETSQLT